MAHGNSKYSQAAADEIISQLQKGVTLAEVCRAMGIGRTTPYDWQDAHPEFAERFARAREIGFDAIADGTLEIADDATNDWMAKRDAEEQGLGYVLNGEHVQRSKLRIETRLKLLSKWDPKRYGDRQQIDLTGSLVISEMSEEDLMAELTELVATGVIKALPAPTDDNEDLI